MTPFLPHYSHDDMWLRIIAMLHENLRDEQDPLRESFLETALVDALAGRVVRANALAFMDEMTRRLEAFRRRGIG